ncbi:beta-1,3-galactosyltransferase 4-like [Amblyomma americanum]
MGLAWNLVLKDLDASCCSQQQATTAFMMCAAAPRAEDVSGVNSSAIEWTGSLGDRVVWRTWSQSSREPPPGTDDVLWGYPDLLVDVSGIWIPCPRLTVLVTTSPERRPQRDTIRSSWGLSRQYPNCTLRVIFFMSVVRGLSMHRFMKQEYRQFKDIVAQAAAPSVQEPPASMAALLIEWVPGHVLDSEFVLRVTDDTHVHVPAVLAAVDQLAGNTSSGTMYGHLSPGGDHLEGCAYMAKSEVFRRLQPGFADEQPNGDEGPLVTGRLARRAGLKLVHLEGIGPCHRPEDSLLQTWLREGNVSSSHLTLHGLQPREMASLHWSLSQR